MIYNESSKQLISKNGVEALYAELENLKVVQRKEVAEKIKAAREQGDLSENAEYDVARDEQRDIESRISTIEQILKNSIVAEKVDNQSVNVGTTVTLHNITNNEDVVYAIVGSSETNSLEGKISNESPLGKALMNKKVGEIIKLEILNGGIIEYKIKSINYSI